MKVHEAQYHAPEPLGRVSNPGVHLPAQERFDGLELSPKPLGNGLALNGEKARRPNSIRRVLSG
jgi:hypothetical protein